jgi:hypothetical protein
MRRRMFQLLLCAALSSNSCAANPVGPTELTSADTLVQTLVQQGAAVTRAGAMPASAYPFFSVNAKRIVLNGADVQVFEYSGAARADSDAARVAPTGTPVGQSQSAWMDTPNFYKRDRLIVLYVGHSGDVMKLLESVLGPPFARGQ